METSIASAVNDLPKARTRLRRQGALLAILCLAPWVEAPAEWRVIHSEPANFVEFDADTVREAPPLRLAWTRITFTQIQRNDGPDFQSQGQLHAIDCAGRKSTVVGKVNYSGALGQGEALERQTRPRAEWQPKTPPPESLAALIIDLTCRARGKP